MLQSMLESCPPALKDMVIRLLKSDQFVEAKDLLEQWRSQATSNVKIQEG